MAVIIYFLRRTPFVDNWTNAYTHFSIDLFVVLTVVAEYYFLHFSSILFFIGVSLYVRSMENDLKVELEEIHQNVQSFNGMIDREFKRNFFNEVQFHARLYE